MKSLSEMDLEEWELLPDDGFLEIHDDGGKKIYSRKYVSGPTSSILETNYFVCPPKSSPQFADTTNNQLLPVPIHFEPVTPKSDEQKVPKQVANDLTKTIPLASPINTGSASSDQADQDPVSHVFFKKMKDTEFVDMKVESPKASRSGIMPQMEGGGGLFQFDENGTEAYKVEALDSKTCEDHLEESNWGLNVWKWSLSGVGAICSFGVAAAATVCIIAFGNHRRKNKQQNQKLQFQIYTHDKRIHQVVHQASKINEAISAVRGVPITRAHVTFGGYYDAV